jgi:hypothetical protein
VKDRTAAQHKNRLFEGASSGTMGRMSQPDPQPSADASRLLPENFWTVATTAMTQREAEEAAGFIGQRFADVHAFAVNPRSAFTLGLDRWTAEVVREALVR